MGQGWSFGHVCLVKILVFVHVPTMFIAKLTCSFCKLIALFCPMWTFSMLHHWIFGTEDVFARMTLKFVLWGAGYMFSPTFIFRELAFTILKVAACFFLFNMIVPYMIKKITPQNRIYTFKRQNDGPHVVLINCQAV